jgi:hypothetical protein
VVRVLGVASCLQDFAAKLASARRIAVVGNGGIALELV